MNENLKKLQRQAEQLNEALSKLTGSRKEALFSEYAKAHLEAKLLNPTLRQSTKEAFTNQVVKHLIPGFGHLSIESINNKSFLQWVTEKRKNYPAFRFFNSRKYLIELLLAAKGDGIIDRLPKLDNPDIQRSVGRALSDTDIFKIIRNTKERTFRFFFYVLYKMGCRPQEILRWEWSFIDFNEPGKTWINIPSRISKTGRERRIPVNPQVSRRLAEMHKIATSVFVFPNPENPGKPLLAYSSQWKSACKRAGVKAVPYDLRRTFITRCASEGKPLLYIAKILDTSIGLLEKTYAKEAASVMEDILK